MSKIESDPVPLYARIEQWWNAGEQNRDDDRAKGG